MKGIDLSTFQKNVDYSKLKKQGIEFAIIRAGYGKDKSQKDEMFEKHYKGLKKAGIKVGAYLYSYCSNVDNSILEAKNCLSFIKGKDFELPIFYDLEDRITKVLGKEKITQIAINFCEEIKKNGYIPGIYANLDWFTNYIDINKVNQYKIWLAQWEVSKPTAKFNYDYWQYTSEGKIEGISGNVDLNISYDENLNNSSNSSNNEQVQRIKDLQTALNKDFKCNLAVDGIIGTFTTNAVMSHYLKYYTAGNFVKWTQTNLERKGYSVGSYGIDGCYGRDTEKAVKAFQKNNNLIIDGCVGIETVKRLVQ